MALTVLISWYANIAALRALWPGSLSINPVTALMLLSLSVAVIAIGQRALALHEARCRAEAGAADGAGLDVVVPPPQAASRTVCV